MSGRGAPKGVIRKSKRGRVPKNINTDEAPISKQRRKASNVSSELVQNEADTVSVSQTTALSAEAQFELVNKKIDMLTEIQRKQAETSANLAAIMQSFVNQQSMSRVADSVNSSPHDQPGSSVPAVHNVGPNQQPIPNVPIQHNLDPFPQPGPSGLDHNIGSSLFGVLPETLVTQAAAGSKDLDHIPQKLIARIQQAEFVDLADILAEDDNHTEEESIPLGGYKLVRTKNKKLFLSWNLYVEAWNIYSRIRIRHAPSMALKLNKHFEIVQKIQKKGYGWYYYDINVRKTHARDEPNAKWDEIHPEFWLLACSQNPKPSVSGNVRGAPSNHKFSKTGSTYIPKGFCVKHHKGNKCITDNCIYNHNCYVCAKGQHPAQFCHAKNFRNKKQPTATFAKKTNA